MVQKTMRTARMHVRGEPLTIDQLEVPTPRPTDVLVEVKACGIVPNLGNVLNKFVDWFPHLSLPPLPAIFGLDPAGVVVEKGSQVHGIEIGQRVYVNPAGTAVGAGTAASVRPPRASTSRSTGISASVPMPR